jgi:hypothetical protein
MSCLGWHQKVPAPSHLAHSISIVLHLCLQSPSQVALLLTALSACLWHWPHAPTAQAGKRGGGNGGSPATVGEALAGAASQATAKAANVFLAQGGETQRDTVPAEVAAATAARTSAAKED